MEEEKREHEIKLQKMEVEMEQVFEMKVREKKQKLKDSEADVSFYFPLFYIRNIFQVHPFILISDSCYKQLTGKIHLSRTRKKERDILY